MTYWIIDGVLGTCAVNEETPKGTIIVDIRDLEDDWNDPILIQRKIRIIIKTLSTGMPVIIRCQAGMSRSNAIAIATLCHLNGKNWEENEELVRKRVPRMQLNMNLRDACKRTVRVKV